MGRAIDAEIDVNQITNTELLLLIDDKVDKVTGKGLSTNDYTTEEKQIVGTIGQQVEMAINDLKTDQEFISSLKGDKGDDAYETWLALGNEGTEQDFINSLKGDKGEPGNSSYTYIAYASDASGANFTTTFNASLDYVAMKTTTSAIANPQASDFAGLWKNYKGEAGSYNDLTDKPNIISKTIGVSNINSSTVSTGTNRTRIDNLYPMNCYGYNKATVKEIRIYCYSGGEGKIKFLRKTSTNGQYTILKDISYTFSTGLNTIGIDVIGSYEAEYGCYIAFYSETAVFNVQSGVTGNGYLLIAGELTNNSVSSVTNGILQFQVDLEYIVEYNNRFLDIENRGFNYSDIYYEYDINGNGTGKGLFTVYCKLFGNVYIGHKIGRETDLSDAVYKDIYRYLGCYSYTYKDGMMYQGLQLITGQESEFVWRRNDSRIDFTGGFHGDEIMTGVNFFIDGQPISLLSNIAFRACIDFYYIQHSTMHEAPTAGGYIVGHPVDCNHIKISRFTTGGYTTRNIIEFVREVPVSLIYGGICCVGRNLVNYCYTDKDYINRDVDTYDISLLGGTGLRKYTTYNQTTQYGIECESSLISATQGTSDVQQVLLIADNGSPLQYKKYYRGSNSFTANNADRYEFYSLYKFKKIY